MAAVSVALLAAVLAAELLLQLGSAVVPSINRVTSKGLDSRGYRNDAALESAAIVALGDSHTFGTHVRAEQAWPRQLSALLGQPVYNMGVQGYGPGEANEILPIALRLRPKLVILALNFGNDFYDAFSFSLRNGLLRGLVSSSDLKKIDSLESSRSIQVVANSLAHAVTGHLGSDSASSIRVFVSNRSRLWGLLRSVKDRLVSTGDNALLMPDFDQARRSLRENQLPYVSVFEGDQWKTIFTSPYRLLVEDDRDLRIRRGFEISERTIGLMHDRVRATGARFVVLLLPTKEYVFWPKVAQPLQHRDLDILVQTEERLRQEVAQYMDARGIDYIDPGPELRNSLQQPYFANGDGHPNPLGHLIIAQTVQRYLADKQLF